MPTSELPARPSLESLRKQAKKLARDTAAGDAAALARARAQQPQTSFPLSQRAAQLVLAREYGFPGWPDLVKEVERRLGRGLEWAAAQARRIIHDNDLEALRRLLSEYPALLSWQTADDDGGLLAMATSSYGDSGDPSHEEHFTRLACAELLLDAGAVVAPSIAEGLLRARARRLLDLFHRRGLLPPTLKFLAALGDVDAVRASLNTSAADLAAVNEAFMYACHLQQPSSAALLLDAAITLDDGLGHQIDAGPGRSAFVQYFLEHKPEVHTPDPFEPWNAFVSQQVDHAMRDGDTTTFVDLLRREPWLLSTAGLQFQARWIEVAVLNDRANLLETFLTLDPAILHTRLPPPSQAIEFAFTYVKTHLLPLLLRIWPVPDDLPHAAGNGDLGRVKRWFNAEGQLALGDLTHHFPANNGHYRQDLHAWFGSGEPNEQRILDTALAWAVLNNHFEVADFLLAHGADINTNWCSHEPASILHELVWHRNYQAMQFLIDRGIDMTIRDYRWNATAEGWAAVAANDEKLAQWLRDARQQRERASQASPEAL
ncbi:ankyrin repeat domain-containing protein [Paludibaculum fermentans]|uniref:ankyrin repeat domain-containing protein n=1 Tax=Paludibaculum fermentans TaxID=1473598 RepID=UPI003EB8DC09